MRFRLALLFSLICTTAFAQVTPGTSPMTGPKGGTNNAFMQFSGPAASLKTYTLPNASDTIATLAAIQTWTGAKSFTDGTLILLGSSSGSSTLKAPATGGGIATLFPGVDTVAGLAATQTLTNKTFNCANNTCTVRIANDVTGMAAGAATFLTTPTSANLRTLLTDESGTGAALFAGGALGAATATSINGVTISAGTGTLSLGSNSITLGNSISISGGFTQAGASALTLTTTGVTNSTLPAGTHTLSAPDVAETISAVKTYQTGDLALSGSTSGTSILNAPATGGGTATLFPGSDTVAGLAATQTLTNKTINCSNNTCSNYANATNAAKGVMEGDGATISCVAGVCSSVGSAATAVTLGTTTVTGGTPGDLLSMTNTGCSGTTPCLTQVAAAAKTDQQIGTSTTLPVTPSQQQSHDSATKAWVNFVGATGVINSSYNVTSVTRTSSGNYNVTFTTAFANAFYNCQVTPETSASLAFGLSSDAATLKTTTQIRVFVANTSNVTVDTTNVNVSCHGRQ